MENDACIVIDSRHDSTRRLNQSSTTAGKNRVRMPGEVYDESGRDFAYNRSET